MKRPLLPALATSLLLSLPAQALDLDSMSDTEREAFRSEVRAYLMENPEVIMEAVAILEQREQEAKAEFDKQMVRAHADDLFSDGHSWEGGNPQGDIVLVEFTDYRCAYCRKAYDEVESLIEADGDIRFIVKEFPILGEESELSSRFAIAVQQLNGAEAYKAAHDTLIKFKGPINDTTLTRVADTLGLDAGKVLDHMQSDDVTAVIAANRELANRLQISGTPTFVMNDEMLRGYLPLEGLMQLAQDIRSQ